MRKLKYAIVIDLIITILAIILMINENNSSNYGLAALGSVGRFVIYMGVSILGVFVFGILVLTLIIKVLRKNGGKE